MDSLHPAHGQFEIRTAQRVFLVVVAALFSCAEWGMAQLSVSGGSVATPQSVAAGTVQHGFRTVDQVAGIHSPGVRAAMSPQFKLIVRQRHSQLLIMKSGIRRLAVTDSSICNYFQYSPAEVAVVGLQPGNTDLMIWFQGQETPAIYEVSVVPDDNLEEQHRARLGSLQNRVDQLFPNSRVRLISIGNQVVVQGQAHDTNEARQILKIVRSEIYRITHPHRVPSLLPGPVVQVSHASGPHVTTDVADSTDVIVNLLKVPGEFNIKMRVVIAEISRTRLRDMGADLNVMFNDGRRGIGASIGGPTRSSLSGIFENGEMSALVRWLTTNNTATLLAEPTIVCMSGHSASLLAGGEFAVPGHSASQQSLPTTFRGVGTSIHVTPTVVDRDLIRLKIEPEFSALDERATVHGIPGTTVKRLNTTVELREGQTLALGGLVSRKTNTGVRKVPILGRIPFIGSRFLRGKESTEEEVELLVLVTPEIVRPMEPDEVPPLPGFCVTRPTDSQLYAQGQTEGTPDTSVYHSTPFGSASPSGQLSGYSLHGLSTSPRVVAQPTVPREFHPPAQIHPKPHPGPSSTGVPVQTSPDRVNPPVYIMPQTGQERPMYAPSRRTESGAVR